MKLTSLALVLTLALGCGSKKPDEPEPAPTTDPTVVPDQPVTGCEQPTDGSPMTPDQCTCLGGRVKGDIGDGQVACDPGERELGRVDQGIEGAICCAPGDAAQTP